ncbi:hypothetical protein BJY01DRAFT_171457 [Aspergillus pseudoustus]|uniref:Uncharacterized protein n=1 Tax=Aspergillus pseudoustus TaxID=1810923 RepID=A0ABR4KZI2_9EURO
MNKMGQRTEFWVRLRIRLLSASCQRFRLFFQVGVGSSHAWDLWNRQRWLSPRLQPESLFFDKDRRLCTYSDFVFNLNVLDPIEPDGFVIDSPSSALSRIPGIINRTVTLPSPRSILHHPGTSSSTHPLVVDILIICNRLSVSLHSVAAAHSAQPPILLLRVLLQSQTQNYQKPGSFSDQASLTAYSDVVIDQLLHRR